MDSTVDTSILQSIPTCETRLESSPALYCLKKSAGSDITRIMVAASTEMFSLVSIRAVIMFFTAEISSVLTETQTKKTAIAASSRMLPDSRTRSNSSLFSIGVSIPKSDSASVARAISTKSDAEKVPTMYLASPGRLSFCSGKGL
ncbi:unknown [Clostridium sp. CAG:448]|nr:unknown [Clostridium sp. CAG:448]